MPIICKKPKCVLAKDEKTCIKPNPYVQFISHCLKQGNSSANCKKEYQSKMSEIKTNACDYYESNKSSGDIKSCPKPRRVVNGKCPSNYPIAKLNKHKVKCCYKETAKKAPVKAPPKVPAKSPVVPVKAPVRPAKSPVVPARVPVRPPNVFVKGPVAPAKGPAVPAKRPVKAPANVFVKGPAVPAKGPVKVPAKKSSSTSFASAQDRRRSLPQSFKSAQDKRRSSSQSYKTAEEGEIKSSNPFAIFMKNPQESKLANTQKYRNKLVPTKVSPIRNFPADKMKEVDEELRKDKHQSLTAKEIQLLKAIADEKKPVKKPVKKGFFHRFFLKEKKPDN